MFRVIYQGRAQHLGQKMNSMKANLQMDFKMFYMRIITYINMPLHSFYIGRVFFLVFFLL